MIHFTMKINDNPIGELVAVRKIWKNRSDGVYTYEVRISEGRDVDTFELDHQYDDRAWVLMEKAIAEYNRRKNDRTRSRA